MGGVNAVIRSTDGTMWYKDAGNNFCLPVPGERGAMPVATAEGGGDIKARLSDDLSRAIVDAEVNSSQWTLMHRWVGGRMGVVLSYGL